VILKQFTIRKESTDREFMSNDISKKFYNFHDHVLRSIVLTVANELRTALTISSDILLASLLVL